MWAQILQICWISTVRASYKGGSICSPNRVGACLARLAFGYKVKTTSKYCGSYFKEKEKLQPDPSLLVPLVSQISSPLLEELPAVGNRSCGSASRGGESR